MEYLPTQPSHARSADQSRLYAEWAVRRIGRAFAIAIFGPVVLLFAIYLLVPAGDNAAEAMAFLGSAAMVSVAVLSLCFARAPHR